jgi:hypothetical protein
MIPNQILPDVKEHSVTYRKSRPDESLFLKYKLQNICTLILVFITQLVEV